MHMINMFSLSLTCLPHSVSTSSSMSSWRVRARSNSFSSTLSSLNGSIEFMITSYLSPLRLIIFTPLSFSFFTPALPSQTPLLPYPPPLSSPLLYLLNSFTPFSFPLPFPFSFPFPFPFPSSFRPLSPFSLPLPYTLHSTPIIHQSTILHSPLSHLKSQSQASTLKPRTFPLISIIPPKPPISHNLAVNITSSQFALTPRFFGNG